MANTKNKVQHKKFMGKDANAQNRKLVLKNLSKRDKPSSYANHSKLELREKLGRKTFKKEEVPLKELKGKPFVNGDRYVIPDKELELNLRPIDSFSIDEVCKICVEYERECLTINEVAAKWCASAITIMQILRSKEGLEFRIKIRNLAMDKANQYIVKNEDRIDNILDKVLDQLENTKRIEKAEIKELNSTFSALLDKRIRLKELAIKEEEMYDRKKLLGDSSAEENKGLLKDFVEAISKEE